jgi:ParB-like chromosome segregation protein Spo0J
MRVKNITTDSIIPYARNPRINEATIDKVAASIAEFGWRQPIVVDEAMVVIAGHTRLLAAQKLKQKTVPVHVAEGLTPEQIKAYRLADNRTQEDSAWDYELLTLELAELQNDAPDLFTGFSEAELENLLTNPGAPQLDDLDDRSDESDFWPAIYVKVSPDTKQRWDQLMEDVSQYVESENEAVERILTSVDTRSLATV